MIDVRDLSRCYGDLTAVDRVSFQIEGGEIVGLLGHNGAGKTTIMKMLTGYLEPSAGSIRIAGQELAADRRRAQARIGYLPENCPLYPEMRVVDFLDYTATLRGLGESKRPEAIRRVVAQTELEAKAMAPIGTLSRGYRQRVGVAQALLHRPEILILDEPTNGLDPGQIEHMRQLIRALGRSTTVMISTHILQEVAATCDRVLILRQGALALDARLADLTRGSGLQLRCAAPVEAARQRLQQVPGVGRIELQQADDSVCCWRLEPETAPEETAAAVADTVIAAGWPLYALQPEQPSLERIFHDITAKEVNDDAV